MKKLILITSLVGVVSTLFAQFGPENQILDGFSGPFYSVSTHDIDGDGDLDLVVGSSSLIVSYENTGGGTLGNKREVAVHSEHSQIEWLDVDNDGDLDVAYIARLGEKILWHENNGKGDFGPARIVHALNLKNASRFSSAHPADFDGDGDLDYLACYGASPYYELAWYENVGGVFKEGRVVGPSGLAYNRLEGADMDGDGDVDAVALSNDVFHWYENLGKGSFLNDGVGVEHKVSMPTKTRYKELMDVDADGDPDLLVGGDHGIQWLENLGSGDLGDPEMASEEAESSINFLEVLDTDGDEILDIVTRDVGGPYVLTNMGDGTFKKTKIEGVPTFTGDDTWQDYRSIPAKIVDLNSDGKVDVITVDGREIAWFKNKGQGSFEKEQVVDQIYKFARWPSYFNHVYANYVDLNDDGVKDVVTGVHSREIVWSKGSIDGSFGPMQVLGSEPAVYWVGGTDIDEDGHTDVLAFNNVESEGVIVFKGNGDGTFKEKEVLFNLYDRRDPEDLRFTLVDFDNDQDMDVLWFTQSNVLVWAENEGKGIFENKATILKTDADWGIKLVDLDNDGWLDILLAQDRNAGIYWHRNKGDGTFDIFPINGQGSIFSATDMNGDGLPDIVCRSQRGTDEDLMLIENEGNGEFGKQVVIGSYTLWEPGSSYSLGVRTLADVDGDGYKDLLVSKSVYGGMWWMKNFENQRLSTPYLITDRHRYPDQVRMEDLDHDGDLDLFLVNDLEMRISWYENFFNSLFKLKGKVFYDENQNGTLDQDERPLGLIKSQVNPSSEVSYTNNQGVYFHAVNKGEHRVSYVAHDNWKLTSDSTEYHRYVTEKNPVHENLDFGFYQNESKTVLTPSFRGARARCNSKVMYWIRAINDGTTLPSGIIELELDDSLEFISCQVAPDSIVDQKIYWHFDKLFFRDKFKLNVIVQMPSINLTDNDLSSTMRIHETDGTGEIVETADKILEQEVSCAFDPNDKNVSPKGNGPLGIVAPQQELTYLVRFQNTGNDTAFTVLIRDQLDANLDWSTLKPISSSHPMEVNIEHDGDVAFKFNDILLPDSNVNEPESHGYVEYSIMPKTDVRPLATITGPAAIYFDFNPAVITNDVLNTILCFTAPNPSVKLNFPHLEVDVIGDYSYQWYRNDTLLEGDTLETLVPTFDGAYTVEVTDTNTCGGVSKPFEYLAESISEIENLETAVYPNPFSETTTFLFNGDLAGNFDLVIYDVAGAEVLRYSNINGNQFSIHKEDLGTGLFLPYLVSHQTGQKIPVEKIVAQ